LLAVTAVVYAAYPTVCFAFCTERIIWKGNIVPKVFFFTKSALFTAVTNKTVRNYAA
jgi:predicted membrane protein